MGTTTEYYRKKKKQTKSQKERSKKQNINFQNRFKVKDKELNVLNSQRRT